MQSIDSHGPGYDRELGPEPTLHEPVSITESELGAWTEVFEGSRLVQSVVDDYSYLMQRVQLGHARLGKFCSVAADVRLGPSNHPIDRPSGHHFTYRTDLYDLGEDDDSVFEWRADQPVTVGHDVWVGHGAIVLPGVEIGNGACVGAGSVVTRDVDPYTVVAGNPADPIRRRFDPETAARLEATAWWEWDHETLADRIDAFRDLDTFLAEYAPETVEPIETARH